MKAVVFHDVGDIRLVDVADPKIREPFDVIIRTTASATCLLQHGCQGCG